jgi:hypothetical protein
VRNALDQPLQAGAHSVVWNRTDATGAPAPAGVYYFVLRADGHQLSKRVVVIR